MSTAIDYKRHIYTLSKELATVLHFQYQSDGHDTLLTNKIKLSKDRGFSQASGVLFWLHLREGKKWGRPLTGLRPVGNMIYYGDIEIAGRKSLLVFHLNTVTGSLIIDIFKGFYPSHKGILNKILESQAKEV